MKIIYHPKSIGMPVMFCTDRKKRYFHFLKSLRCSIVFVSPFQGYDNVSLLRWASPIAYICRHCQRPVLWPSGLLFNVIKVWPDIPLSGWLLILTRLWKFPLKNLICRKSTGKTVWVTQIAPMVRIKRDEFFSCKAKQILGNFQERAIFLWLLSFDRSKESNGNMVSVLLHILRNNLSF